MNQYITTAIYTFVDGKTGETTHIAVEPLRAAIIRAGVIPVLAEIGGTLITALERGDLGVEEEYALKLPDAALDVPGIVCEWGKADHVIADGAHRLWRRWKRGDATFPAYIIPEKAWRLYVVDDIPGDGKFWDHFNRNAKVR